MNTKPSPGISRLWQTIWRHAGAPPNRICCCCGKHHPSTFKRTSMCFHYFTCNLNVCFCMETSHFNGHYYIPKWHIYIVVVYLFCMSLGRVRSKEPKKLLDFRAAWFHSFSRSSLSLSSTSSSSTGQRSHGNCWISGQPGLTSASRGPRHLSKASSVSL